jgi:hypothetical protein
MQVPAWVLLAQHAEGEALLGAAPVVQAGVVLPTPEGIPVEAVTPDVCLSMLAAVPAAVDTGDVRTAKATVQATAAELQVGKQLSHCLWQCWPPSQQQTPLSDVCTARHSLH